jgi:MYXO-CTERM domain-containing protein
MLESQKRRLGTGATFTFVRMKRCFLFPVVVVVALSTTAAPASAGPQHWPFSFDVSIAADPAGTGQKIAQGDATYPLLPVSRMATLQSGPVTLYVWPEVAAMLQRAEASATAPPMTWPTTPKMCVAHAGFTIPPLLVANPSAACSAADTSIRQALADLGACADVEQPELYALAYDPSNARQTCGSIEDMIGQAGEAWSHAPAPQVGLLPSDWVTTLRVVLDKIRHDPLAQHVTTAKASYAQALGLLSANAACFQAAPLATVTTGLQTLTGELGAAAAYLEQLKTTGEATRTQEEVCLAAKSRVRQVLTYPSLTRPEREFVAFWLGGTYWRMRGGGLIPLGATQDARWYFVNVAFSQIGKMVGGQDGVDAAFQLYLPLLGTGWSDWQDMGNGPGADKYDDLVSMTARGETQVHGATTLLAQRGYDTLDLTAGGLQMGPGYYRGYYPLQDFRYAAEMLPQPPYSDGISWPTAIGEFTVGASMGLGLAHVLLDGVDTKQPPTANLCANRACGDDGCGGSCGTCATGKTCTAGQCVVPSSCAPSCAGKTCGDDGCGGSCGACSGGASSGSAPPPSDAGAAAAAPPDTTSSAPTGTSAGGCGCRSAGEGGAIPLAGAGFFAVFAALNARRRRRS